MSDEKQTKLNYIIVLILFINMLFLGGIFFSLQGWNCGKGTGCLWAKKGSGKICPYSLKGSNYNPSGSIKGSGTQQ